MSRISMIPAAAWPAELRNEVGVDDRAPLEHGIMRIAAHRPSIALGLIAFGKGMGRDALLPPRLVELVRLRIAFHNQCRSCMAIRYTDGQADRVSEELVCSLARPMEAPDLTEAERAALDFADRFATDHLSIDDVVYASLRAFFSEGELVELGFHCARFVGIGRLAATWNMIEDLPSEYRDPKALLAPWSVPPAVHIVARHPGEEPGRKG